MALDWNEIFGLTVSPLELFIRGTAIYLFLFLIFRIILRRDVGSVGMADVLVLVIIADAAQNGMSGDYRSVTDGMVLIATIVGWNVLIDFLCFRFPRLRSIIQPKELQLIRDGRMNKTNMRREMLTDEELLGKLREHGIGNLSDVKAAYMESDGTISVLRRDKADTASEKKQPRS